jgi:ribosomal protein S18 acetylase RimI-like enzyme
LENHSSFAHFQASAMFIEITPVDYFNTRHAQDLTQLLNEYAQDAMGGQQALSESAQKNLCKTLAKMNTAHSFICYVDNQAAGLINCFEGFSTFKAKPLLNIHDVYINSKYRGLGISQKLLNTVEELAQSLDCCKITLEVLAGNTIAQSAYKNFGFEGYQLDDELGVAEFWQKPLL